MKKNLFFMAAALAFCFSCSNDATVEENNVAKQGKEIAISAIATPNTRAAVDGTTFPTDLDMMVTAYDATAGANYFAATEFSYGTSTWKGSRYWPFTPATINFLAIANANTDNATGVTWGPESTNPTEKVQIVMANNRTNQLDLMYACGTGTVTQTGSPANTLNFPENVPMEFKHAQAWVKFTVQAGDATSASKITVNSITLNSVSCQGTYTVTHTNWNKTKVQRDADATNNGSVAGVWSAYDTYVGNVPAVAAPGYSTFSTSVQDFASLMVVPDQGMASFTIAYSLDGKDYTYTYTPASTSLAQATKYIYNIKLTVHEIEIAATVATWADGGSTAVNI